MSRLQTIQNIIKASKGIKFPEFVKIVEVGPRDGLQNEKQLVTTEQKIQFINQLSETGLKVIETTSFVSKKWVPQMGDASEVFSNIIKLPTVNYPVLVPNLKGLEAALKVGVQEIAVFGAASETFSQKNINCSIAESLKRFEEVVTLAHKNKLRIRGYVSCVMGCPYQGDINPLQVAEVTKQLFNMGCYEVSLGDTIGVGTPEKTDQLFTTLLTQGFDISTLAAHFHDTYDKAIPNLLVALKHGVSVIDSSVAGLGGCPYAGKPSGNVATESVVYALNELNIKTGVDLLKLQAVGKSICTLLERQNLSILE